MTDIVEDSGKAPPRHPDDFPQVDLNLRYKWPLKGDALRTAGKIIDPPRHVDTSTQSRLSFPRGSSQASVAQSLSASFPTWASWARIGPRGNLENRNAYKYPERYRFVISLRRRCHHRKRLRRPQVPAPAQSIRCHSMIARTKLHGSQGRLEPLRAKSFGECQVCAGVTNSSEDSVARKCQLEAQGVTA
jgi:hypothetical protein